MINLYSKEKPFYCLMTYTHVIMEELINKRITILFCYDFGRKSKEIKLEKRFIKTFKNENIDESYSLDATVIQILAKDKISKEYFLLPNYNFMSDFGSLKSKEITIVQYPPSSLGYSYGEITDIKNYEMAHSASTVFGSSGSPIFLKDTEKVIGIHKNCDKNDPKNYGDFIGPIYQYFKRRKLKLNIFNKGPAPGYDNKISQTIYGRKFNNKKVNKQKIQTKRQNKNVINEVFTFDGKKEGNGQLIEKNGDISNGEFQTELFNGIRKTRNYDDLDGFMNMKNK